MQIVVTPLEQNRWSLIAVLYNQSVFSEESPAIEWKLDEIKEIVSTDYQRRIITIPVITYRTFFHLTGR